MLENLVISVTGVVLGAIMAVGLNRLLVEAFEVDPGALLILVSAAMAALVLSGQVATQTV